MTCVYQYAIISYIISGYEIIDFNMTGKQSHNSLRINVGFLLNQPVGTYQDIQFEPETIEFSPEFVVEKFSGSVRVSRTRTGILAQADFRGEVPMDCVRCLEKYSQKLNTIFSELFAFKKEFVTDSELLLPENAFMNLAPLAYEYLLLEVPILTICSPSCKGLCPICGMNINDGICKHMGSEMSIKAVE